MKLRVKVISAEESNFLEDAGRKLSVSSDTLEFDLGAYEIETFKLRLQALLSARPPDTEPCSFQAVRLPGAGQFM